MSNRVKENGIKWSVPKDSKLGETLRHAVAVTDGLALEWLELDGLIVKDAGFKYGLTDTRKNPLSGSDVCQLLRNIDQRVLATVEV
jgi:hypothetical protein